MATFRTVFRSDIDHLKAHYLRLDPPIGPCVFWSRQRRVHQEPSQDGMATGVNRHRAPAPRAWSRAQPTARTLSLACLLDNRPMQRIGEEVLR